MRDMTLQPRWSELSKRHWRKMNCSLGNQFLRSAQPAGLLSPSYWMNLRQRVLASWVNGVQKSWLRVFRMGCGQRPGALIHYSQLMALRIFGVVLGEFGLDELGPVGLEILISCGVPGLIDDPIMDKSLHIGFTDVGFEVGQKLESLFVRNGGECIVWVLSLGEREKT